MSLWRQLTRGLRVLTHRTASDQDVSDELQHYLDQSTGAFLATGLSPAEARRAARLEIGSMTVAREQVRDHGWENVVSTLLADVRYAARRLRDNPGFTGVGVLTLALGIGAATAIFSAVNPILFAPLPYPTPNRIVAIWDTFQGSHSEITFHNYRELATRSRSFEALAVFKEWQPTMTGAAQPERFNGQSVSAGYFQALGVRPAMGRDFTEADDRFQGPPVIILSDALWRRRFAADRAIAGHQVTLNDNLYTVIGVMPRGFENVLLPAAELWSPLQYNPQNSAAFESQEWGHHLRMIARLRPRATLDGGTRDLNSIALAPVSGFPRPPWASLRYGVLVHPLQDDIARGVKPALLAVLGAVMLVLLIASVNVTNLLLARGAQRRGEFAMRAALGAGRSRLVRQLLTESLLLALIGGALGMLVAKLGVGALVALSPPGLPRVAAIQLNAPVFLFALGITTLIGLLVGLIPAFDASRGDLINAIQRGSRRTAGGHHLTRRALVVSEVALALILLIGAGLLLRSLDRLFAIAPGFDSSHLLTMQVHESGHRFDQDSARLAFFAQALEAVRNVPSVTAAAFTSLLPLSGDPYGEYGTQFENGDRFPVSRYAATPGYCEAMGIPLRRGRFLNAHDAAGAPPVLLISESLARHEFPSRDPLGQRLHVGPTNRPWYTIVGVVGDVKQSSLAELQPDAVYLSPAQSWFQEATASLVVRAPGDAAQLAPAIQNAVWSVNKDQPITKVITMDRLLAASESQRRFAMIVFEAFALAALVLAAIGIYGVLAGSVTERLREIGIRTALGASRAGILSLVVRQGMSLAAIGIVIGLSGALAATRAIVTLLFGISRLDPATYLGVIVLLLAVSALACWVPAWRASRVDPSITLRAE